MNPFRRFVHRFGGRRWFPRVFRRVIPLDATLRRWTSARIGLTDLAGLTGLLLTTTGRRSGEPRTVALIYVEDGGNYVVAGSNWGGRRHPAWSANLLADPVATVTVAGHALRVKAHLAEGPERARCWALLLRSWPAYAAYATRADREIRVFVLEPVTQAG